MKLHENQLNLIRHLIRFNLMTYEDCLSFLDTEKTGNKVALSYVFRPLTKNRYLSKNKRGIVSVLKKGRELFPEEVPLISTATGATAQQRVLQVSRVAMWLGKCGVPTFSEQQDTEEPYFIPSACWRKIALGILSTTRFAGMLMAYDKRYVVYDIGDGTMEWQVRAESSLFYYRYGSFETKAHGMILICEDSRRDEIAKQIIRQTMWSRKSLLKEQYSETNKPVRYSRSPIKLRPRFQLAPHDSVIVFRHIYSTHRPGWEHCVPADSEIDCVIRLFFSHVFRKISPIEFRHYHCCAIGEEECTEVYVMPATDLGKWISQETSVWSILPKGEKLYRTAAEARKVQNEGASKASTATQ